MGTCPIWWRMNMGSFSFQGIKGHQRFFFHGPKPSCIAQLDEEEDQNRWNPWIPLGFSLIFMVLLWFPLDLPMVKYSDPAIPCPGSQAVWASSWRPGRRWITIRFWASAAPRVIRSYGMPIARLASGGVAERVNGCRTGVLREKYGLYRFPDLRF